MRRSPLLRRSRVPLVACPHQMRRSPLLRRSRVPLVVCLHQMRRSPLLRRSRVPLVVCLHQMRRSPLLRRSRAPLVVCLHQMRRSARLAKRPFKSAFGSVPAPDAAKPAATPFKSAFGSVPAPDAAKPAATPFKSAFGSVPAPDAAKPAATPFKSAFGSVPAPDAAKPAATPFKSAFGSVPAPDAAKPAATPFKSAFGSVPAPDAAKPAATPFKSAFGSVPAPDAAKPAATPFKSAFGSVPAPDAAKPAATPFKSAFGSVPAPDAAKPAATPYKSGFDGISDASFANHPTSVSLGGGFGGVGDSASTATSLAPCTENGMPMVSQRSSNKGSLSAALPKGEGGEATQRVCVGPEGVWRCCVCHKVKDLKGPHLNGKASVRSDCWPCAKKTTFVHESSGDGPLEGAGRPAGRVAVAADVERLSVCGEHRTTVFKAPVVPSEAEEPSCMLPVTKAGKGQGSAAEGAGLAALSGNVLWRCAVCHKVKDLKGPHLSGKTSVRSDCWPCAKKTTFLRDTCAIAGSGAAAELVSSAPKTAPTAEGATPATSDAKASVLAEHNIPPFLQTTACPSGFIGNPSCVTPFKSAFGGVPASDAAKPAATPFKSAFGGVPAPDAARTSALQLKTVFSEADNVDDVRFLTESKNPLQLSGGSKGTQCSAFEKEASFSVPSVPGDCAGESANASCGTLGSNALVPSRATDSFSSVAVLSLITDALKEHREVIKAELECFRKDLLLEVRQLISRRHVYTVAEDRADFEEPAAEITESLIHRHLTKAFRKF
ncbi:hypothetical_protein [Leishmania braziliensis MHOM/BR/75/M2904]|uniref:Hypothetical_protein n=1 Tax=Leishmania braziliensis MHOM/BR/75/M2904 TaxID=420245 RepID=A0A3P3ZB87_LEIBR|nr:hypothetical_protein [Leishmania braziliensis MHOM/BR/75/M2904]